MRALGPRKPRAPAGSRRHNPPRKASSYRRPSGPWPPRLALNFLLLQQFVRREGHARVVEEHREGNFSLGLWVSKRRTEFRKGLLTPEQVRSLAALPGWTWSPRDDDFRHGLIALKAFVRRRGHARVPHGHREHGRNLGSWVLSRRKEHAAGRLSSDRTRELQAEPGWSWNPNHDAFLTGLDALRRFQKREGHARVPFAHRERGFRLGNWVVTQRTFRTQGRLSGERARLLEALPGWTWHAREDLFDEGMRTLQAFVRREGHSRVPATFVERGIRLGHWVLNRRSDHREGTLSKGRAHALESLAGWTWSVRDTSFETAYRHLLRFVKREGHARVPTAHVEGRFPLGAWVQKRRQQRGRMTDDRARRLTALPGWAWNRFDWGFEEALTSLRAFVRREGHTRVPARHIERGVRLGVWIRHCRSRRMELARGRRRALEGVRGWS